MGWSDTIVTIGLSVTISVEILSYSETPIMAVPTARKRHAFGIEGSYIFNEILLHGLMNWHSFSGHLVRL